VSEKNMKVKNKTSHQKRSPVKTRALLVIDNTPIRKKSIKLAQGWLKKIEDTEKSAKKFQEIDLKLYTDWYNLTFNPVIESIDEARREFLQAAEFHNLMVLVSKEKNISMPAAFLFLKEEEEQYENGDNETRSKIDLTRANRAKAMEAEVNQQNECDCEFCRQMRSEESQQLDPDGDSADKADENDDGGDGNNRSDLFKDAIETMRHEEELAEKSREKFKKQIEYFESISDKKLTKIMRSFEDGASFLVEAISILTQSSRVDLLRRIWKFAPGSLKTGLNKRAKLEFGISIEEMMNDLEERDQIRANFFAFQGKDDDEDGFDSDFFMGPRFRNEKQKKDLKEDDKIRIKSLYRKIVRKIHPDNFNLEVPSELKSWFNSIWQKVAKAHKEEDLEKLSVLHHKIVIALNEYDELGVSDLNTAAKSLESEYKSLLAEYSSLKESPAWNFSLLKDFKKLKSKLSKPFLLQQKELKEDLEDLKSQRAEIERIAGLIKEGKIKLRPQRKARRKTQGRGHRLSKQTRVDSSQMNFEMD
jgi:hypothetical protein